MALLLGWFRRAFLDADGNDLKREKKKGWWRKEIAQ
jgi:hypothetical protein